jgi:hypothetical protein
MKINKRFYIDLCIVLALLFVAYVYRAKITTFVRQQSNVLYPCSRPIEYSIGKVDSRFGISQAQFLTDIQQAMHIWEDPIYKKLFAFATTSTANSDLILNLNYDNRQQTTVELQKINSTIDSAGSRYKNLVQTYNSLLASYNDQKTTLASLIERYQADKASYEQDQSSSREQKRIDLNNEVAIINAKQQSLNALIDTINNDAALLNALAKELNLKVDSYNSVNATIGKEFEEGVYSTKGDTPSITIFQYSNHDKLIRVLAHELGHALGLDHIANNPKAIMYFLNTASNDKLTQDDLDALKAVCKIK